MKLARPIRRSVAIVLAGLALAFAMPGPLAARPPVDGTRAFARGDYVEAARIAGPRAEAGDADAQALLGYLYEHGRGVTQDYILAVHWYTCAAEQGHPTAQYLLGLMYDKGHGVERSDKLAYMWINLAAAHAPRQAREYYLRIRDAISIKLTPEQVAEAQFLASSFVAKLPER